jgi:dephospho-CoA kinase
MDASDALRRIKAQANPAMRARLADRILNSNQSLDLLKKDATKLFAEIQALASNGAQETR